MPQRSSFSNLDSYQKKANGAPNSVFMVLYGIIEAALTWTANQAFQALVSIVASSSSTLLTINQSGSGDILDLKDAGVSRVRVPDGGGVVLVAQAGGFPVVTGLLGYDSAKKRLLFQHETHNSPVPLDPRNSCSNFLYPVTYP